MTLLNGLLIVLCAMMVIIPVTGALEDKIGVYKNREWHRDFNGDGSYPGVTSMFPLVASGWTPIAGD